MKPGELCIVTKSGFDQYAGGPGGRHRLVGLLTEGDTVLFLKILKKRPSSCFILVISKWGLGEVNGAALEKLPGT